MFPQFDDQFCFVVSFKCQLVHLRDGIDVLGLFRTNEQVASPVIVSCCVILPELERTSSFGY